MVQTTARWPSARILSVFSRCRAVVESRPDVGSAQASSTTIKNHVAGWVVAQCYAVRAWSVSEQLTQQQQQQQTEQHQLWIRQGCSPSSMRMEGSMRSSCPTDTRFLSPPDTPLPVPSSQ